ncbi:MAG: response regulator transcription factor [Treponema sp.]|jgi:DNA-binding NarL/FixJ family response regulator|nr:response regulator transcription factor [Treponema sp.]
MGENINILIAAKDDTDRECILTAVSTQKDFSVAGVECDEFNTIIKSERLKPDVLIFDLQPPGADAPILAPIIHRRSPNTSIMMICDRDDNDYAGKALKSGISGFLLKKADMNKIVPVVKIVNLGGYFVSASIASRALDTITFIKQFPGQVINLGHSDLVFSPIERCIITEIAKGLSDEEIAKYLNYSPGSIKNCLAGIKRKTGLKNRLQIVLYSLFYGLIKIEHTDIFKFNRQFVKDPI